MDTKKCALCEKDFDCTRYNGTYENAYLERGISKKHYLCTDCYNNKVVICDYAGNEKKRAEAVESIQKVMEGKSTTMRDIVNAWIDGDEKNYHSNVKDLIYYVKGPEADLYVFKDHLTILSSLEPDAGFGEDIEDYAMFYKCNAPVAYNKIAEVKNYFYQISTNENYTDLEKICGRICTEAGNRYAEKNPRVELNISLGENGSLDFDGNYYSFKFYYHQNQLMEEVYNYILNRMENPDAEDEEVVQTVSNIQKNAENQVETKEDASQVIYSPADEIRKMKDLMDCGILSREEFERAKNRLIDKL